MRTYLALGIIASLMCLAPSPSHAGPRASGRQAVGQQQQTPPPTPQPPETTPAAQGRGAGRLDGAGQRPAVDMAKMQTVQDMLEGFEINQADRALQLTDKQYGEFIQRLRNLQRLRHQHQNQRLRIVGELRRMANQQNPPVEDALLEAPTKRLDDFDKQAFQEMQTAYAQIDEVLNVRQRARFRLFEEAMEQRKLEILARVLKAGAPAPGANKTIK
jgi:hypothetical protein